MRLRLRLKPLSRQGSDGKINHHRLNLMSNPRRVKSPPIIRYNMTEEELEIVINHLIDSKNGGIYGYRTSMWNA